MPERENIGFNNIIYLGYSSFFVMVLFNLYIIKQLKFSGGWTPEEPHPKTDTKP